MLPPQQTRRSAPPIIKLSRLDHAAIALAVYASQCGSPRPTQDSLPAGGQPLPCGTLTRWVRNRRFQVIATSSIPLPQACPGASLFLVYFPFGFLRHAGSLRAVRSLSLLEQRQKARACPRGLLGPEHNRGITACCAAGRDCGGDERDEPEHDRH